MNTSSADSTPEGTADRAWARPAWRRFLPYLIAAAVIGFLWAWHAGRSPFEHALYLIALLVVVGLLVGLVRRRRGGAAPGGLSLGRLIVAKVSLVAFGVAASLLLGLWMTEPDYVVAGLLALVTLVVGPLIHPWLRSSPAVGP